MHIVVRYWFSEFDFVWCKNWVWVIQIFQSWGHLVLAAARWLFWLNFSSSVSLIFCTKTPQIWEINCCHLCFVYLWKNFQPIFSTLKKNHIISSIWSTNFYLLLLQAYSTSDLWYAVLDWGTNYCNLRNLLDGTGLSDSDGFVEKTSNADCTQYEDRDCTRY